MTSARIFVFLSFVFLLLFYPGNYWITDIFSNRNLWVEPRAESQLSLHPIPVVSQQALFPPISAESVFIADMSSFTPIFQHNSNKQLYPASTAKILTALVANDVFKPTDILVVQKTYTKDTMGDLQIMELVSGERITVENLMYGVLVHSAADAAEVLAHAYGYERFVERMNQKAQELGMRSSFFTNPVGVDDTRMVTTSYDLALAGRALLKDPYLLKFVSTKEIIISDVDYRYFHTLSNVNKLLGEVSGIGGLKTGYTELAGQNLVSYYKKNGNQYIIVVLKSFDRFVDTKTLTEWIDQNVTYESMPTR